MKLSIKVLSLFLIIGTAAYAADTASILPPAKTQFLDSNAKPLTSGKVFFYIPSTTTFKTTWQDAAETISNTNPVILDAAGRAIILGSGSYRQIVKDRNDNIIWDQVTSSTGSGSTPTTATGDGDLVGTIKPWAGLTAPNQYAFTYGQEISRTTYSILFTAITSIQAVFCTSGSPTFTGLGDTTFIPLGASVEVSCLASGNSTVVSKTSNSITLAGNSNISTNANALILPWGGGNHINTFNLPDYRGIVPAGNNNMGGVASSNLATFGYGNSTASDPNSVGAFGGSQLFNIQVSQLPPYTPIGTIANGAITSTFTGLSGQTGLTGAGGAQAYTSGGFASSQITGTVASTQLTSGFSGVAQGGTSSPISRIQPTKTVNFIIKIVPDSNSATASGITSLGGMTGDIACGTGLLCTGNTISISIGLPINVPSGGTGDTVLTANNVLIGNGVNPVQFAAPSGVQGCLSSTGASTSPSFGSTVFSQCGPVSYVNSIAAMKNIPIGTTPNVYPLGYYAAGDGGGGEFYGDISSTCVDNGGTCIAPNTGSGRWLRNYQGNDINVRWFGARGDGSTSDQTTATAASSFAISIGGSLYFPAAPFCYLITSLSIPDGTGGLRIHGDSQNSYSVLGNGSVICSNSGSNTIDMLATAGGTINNIAISDLKIYNLGGGDTVNATNLIGLYLDRLVVSGIGGHALNLIGTGIYKSSNVVYYGSAVSTVNIGPSGTTNSGPGNFIGGQISNQGGNATSCVSIIAQTLGTNFEGVEISCRGPNYLSSFLIDGDGTANQTGLIVIKGIHSEDSGNTITSLGSDVLVGNTNPFGTVQVSGWSGYGQGDGTYSQRDSIRVVNAQNVEVTSSNFSKLAASNGYTRSAIRLESTFTGQGQFQNNYATNINGSLYSDARAISVPCTGTGACYSPSLILGTLTLGNPLIATSGGTGFASYAVGDLIYANTTTTLSKLSDVATTNALISGGVGVAPSWGKISNSTLTNSSTTVNGITCTLGSTCTITAAATGVTVGTTTIASGTSHGILTNNAGVLGNTAIGSNGQIFLGVTSAEPNWGTMSGDATITNAGVITLASTITAGGPTGSATVAPIVTYDAKGRLTAVSSATITPAASSITGAFALAKVDDTNITLTLSGSPTIALLAGTTITAGWTGTLANSRLATMATNTVKGNATSGTASPTDLTMTSCSTAASAVIWTTNTGFGCNTSITANTANTATTATNATNGATVAVSTNASFFPLFAASSSNSNQPFNLDTTLTYNPSSDTLTATNFAGNATSATNATNTTITDDTTTNATMYPTWVTANTGNLPQKVSSTKLFFNPATPLLTVGAGGDSPTLASAVIYATNAGQTSIEARDSTNDISGFFQIASPNVYMGSFTSNSFVLRSANTDRLTISNAGVFTFNTIPSSDAATVDNTLCVSSSGVILKGSGALGICLGTSSARYKHDIISMGVGLTEIIQLTPKNFFYKKGFGDDGARLQYGFIAEDVVKVLPGVTAPDKNGKPNSVDMVAMIPILVNAIKQLKSDNDNLRMDVLALQTKQKKQVK